MQKRRCRAQRHGGAPRPATGVLTTSRSWPCAKPRLTLHRKFLKPGGTFLAKVLQGGTEHTLARCTQTGFYHASGMSNRRPAARIPPNLYVLATGYRGQAAQGMTPPRVNAPLLSSHCDDKGTRQPQNRLQFRKARRSSRRETGTSKRTAQARRLAPWPLLHVMVLSPSI